MSIGINSLDLALQEPECRLDERHDEFSGLIDLMYTQMLNGMEEIRNILHDLQREEIPSTSTPTKGLCMFCDEPFTPDHHLKHRKHQLMLLEMEDDNSSEPAKPQTVPRPTP